MQASLASHKLPQRAAETGKPWGDTRGLRCSPPNEMYQPQRQVLAALLGHGRASTGTPGPYSRQPVTEKPIREHRLRREEGPALEAATAAPRYPEETFPVAGTDAAR